MRIAVDAVGGDRAPGAAIEGALAAARQGVAEIVLVGPEEILRQGLARTDASLPVEAVFAPEIIAPDEQPAQAVKRKRRSSIMVGASLVKEGGADAFVSAGNTGALMAAGLIRCGRIPGVHRPAISGIFPTLDGVGCLLLDLGAHMDATARNLYQYAIMGAVYADKVRGVSNPRIGLLNVGAEENKGNELSKEAYSLLKEGPFNFIGNVEGRDIFTRAADVVICDGFVGNVLLKTLEGLGQGLFGLLRKELASGPREKIGALMARPALTRFARTIDYREYGGAPILGVDGVIIKCHGSSDARAMENGIRVAAQVAGERVTDRIRGELEKSEAPAAGGGQGAYGG